MILSICIPTYNRASYLDNTLTQLTKNVIFKETDDVEIVISDNCSTDNTEDVCRKFIRKFPRKIIYRKQKENTKDKNFSTVLKMGRGKYLKLNNDNLFFRPGELEKFLYFLKEENPSDIVIIVNKNVLGHKIYTLNSFDALLEKVSYMVTWIGGYCFKSSAFNSINEPDRYADLNFSQVDMLARLMISGSTCTVVTGNFLESTAIKNKGGYGIPKVFGFNYLSLLKGFKENGYIGQKTFDRHKKELLIKHINKYCFNQDNTLFLKNGYFSYLLPFYWKEYYLYTSFLIEFLKSIARKIFYIRTEKISGKKRVKFLFIKFRFNAKKNINRRIKFNCNSDRIDVGRYTYGEINAEINSNRSEKLIIGDFCSIARGVKFIVSSEHPYHGLSTYPFKFHVLKLGEEATSKGDIVVKDDVWIGLDAIICSGVTIGQGAIVGAGSVVTKDVPPYSIVAGNPAQVVNYRFPDEIIKKLLKFDFSLLSEDKIKKIGTKLYKNITVENVDSLLQEFVSEK